MTGYTSRIVRVCFTSVPKERTAVIRNTTWRHNTEVFFIEMMFKACSKHPIVIVWAINFHPIIIMLFTCFLVVFGGAKCSHGVSVAPCESESNFFRATPKLCLVSLWLLGPLAILVLVTSKVSDREQQLSYPWQQAQVAFLSDATAFACLFWCMHI